MVTCKFQGLTCRPKRDFTQFWDLDYGNCYTFNNISNQTHLTAFGGENAGLQM